MFLTIITVFVFAFIIYDSVPSKCDALEKIFKGHEDEKLKQFENEKSPLHTIVYGGTGTGKNIFCYTKFKAI